MIYELSEQQYNKVVRFWKHINNIEKKLKKLQTAIYNFLGYCNYYDYGINWNDYNVMYAENTLYEQEIISTKSADLLSQLAYYENEYKKYINSIGFELGNYSQSETLFQLLNTGIVIDDY
jgi:hypothetical protein